MTLLIYPVLQRVLPFAVLALSGTAAAFEPHAVRDAPHTAYSPVRTANRSAAPVLVAARREGPVLSRVRPEPLLGPARPRATATSPVVGGPRRPASAIARERKTSGPRR
jgi:hypothetical protein